MYNIFLVAPHLLLYLTWFSQIKVKKWRQLGQPDPSCRALEHLKIILGSAHCAALDKFKIEESA